VTLSTCTGRSSSFETSRYAQTYVGNARPPSTLTVIPPADLVTPFSKKLDRRLTPSVDRRARLIGTNYARVLDRILDAVVRQQRVVERLGEPAAAAQDAGAGVDQPGRAEHGPDGVEDLLFVVDCQTLSIWARCSLPE
jgi:hypothetical protein